MISSVSNVHRGRVVAVISAYRPTAELVAHCTQLAPQVSRIIVVDDASGPGADPVLSALESIDVTVVRQPENLGIGAAMNRGFDLAQSGDHELVVTFDQDSRVPDGYIDALVDELDAQVSAGHRVGMVAPEYFSATSQTRGGRSELYVQAYAPIQSGLLMPIVVIVDLGPQRADYFIDLVDTEYFLRARRAGYIAVCAPGLTLPHGFGHRLYVYAFGRRLRKRSGRPRMVAVSTPFRYYYRVRNRIAMSREYARDPEFGPLLRRDARSDLLLDFGVALYSARGKFALLQVMFAGLQDGLRGRLGKISPSVDEKAVRVTWRHPVVEES